LAVVVLGIGLLGAGLAYFIPPRPPAATDCGGDRNCFYEAYQNGCPASTMRKETPSFEGDPIYFDAVLARQDDRCRVSVSVDASQTLFGQPEAQVYECVLLRFVDGVSAPQLQAEGCAGAGSQGIIVL